MPYVKCPICEKSCTDIYGLCCEHTVNYAGAIHFHKNVNTDCNEKCKVRQEQDKRLNPC